MPHGGRRPAYERHCVEHAHDPRVPSEHALRARNSDFEGMSVEVARVDGKGLGVVARVGMGEGVLTSYYLTKAYKTKHHFSSSEYRMSSGIRGYVLDLFDHSFPEPGEDGIPYIAPLVNEPTYGEQEQNCGMLPMPLDDEDGTLRRHGLVTTRKVAAGEELVWDYGPGYGKRSYPSKYN